MRRRYLVCYDIRDERRLRRTFRVMRTFGHSLQYSVFLCDLSGAERTRMMDALRAVVHLREDSVAVFDLGSPDPAAQGRRVEYLGSAPTNPSAGPAII